MFDRMWSELATIGHDRQSGGYNRFAWTREDAACKDWFAAEALARGLDLVVDRNGNQWAWWGNPDAAPGRGVVVGSHLDSVPSGGAFDGPLGVVSAFLAIDAVREGGLDPKRPIGVVNFIDEEGARFGVACAGSRLLTGALDPERARGLRDSQRISLAEAASAAGHRADHLGADSDTLRRIGSYVELHIEQGRGLVEFGQPIAVASRIWPHGRYRIQLEGRADHAGTTRLMDRQDPMLVLADLIQQARSAAERHDAVATIGKITIEPGAVNAIPSRVLAWLDARGPDPVRVKAMLADLAPFGDWQEESWTQATDFSAALAAELAALLGAPSAPVPILATGAGHDAGILAAAGIEAAMLFVRNPTGTSHSPAEFAERDDCLAGVAALAKVIQHLTGLP